jgi:hypothetical protein
MSSGKEVARFGGSRVMLITRETARAIYVLSPLTLEELFESLTVALLQAQPVSCSPMDAQYLFIEEIRAIIAHLGM